MSKKPTANPPKQQSKFDLSFFQFRGDNVLIKALREDKIIDLDKNGNPIMLTKPEQYDDKPEFGKVVSVGEKVTDIAPGDTVFFGKYSTEQTRALGEDYFILRQEDVKAVLKK